MAQLFSSRARLYCLSALVPGLLGIALLTLVSLLAIRGAGEGQLDSRAIWESMSISHRFLAILGLLLALWAPIILAARTTCRITAEQLSGHAISLSDVLLDMATFIPSALVYSLAIGLPVMIGFGILFVPGMVIASFFVLVVPAAVNERLGIVAAWRRGFNLGGHTFLKNLLITLVCGALLGSLLVLRVAFLDRFLPGSYRSLFAIRFAILYFPALLLLVLSNICFTLLYHDARAKEAKAPMPGAPRR